MPKRSSKPQPKPPPGPDENELAYQIIRKATGQDEPGAEPAEKPKPKKKRKNPAAVSLGRLGGKKGGPARAEKLSKARRRAIGRKGAKARWGKAKAQ